METPESTPPGRPSRGIGWAVTGLILVAALVWVLARIDGDGRHDRGRRESPPPRSLFASLEVSGEPSTKSADRTPEALTEEDAEVRGGGRQIEVLAGRVLFPDGKPVGGARVTVDRHESTTGADGLFVLPRTWGAVRVEHEDSFPRETDADSFPVNLTRTSDSEPSAERLRPSRPSSLEYLDIIVRPGSRIWGRASDEQGHPVDGALLHFGQAEGSPEARTGADGSYESPLLEHGAIHVWANHPGYQAATRLVVVTAPGQRVRSDLPLQRGEALVVETRASDGEPLSDAEVWLRLEAKTTRPDSRPGLPKFAPLGTGSAEPAEGRGPGGGSPTGEDRPATDGNPGSDGPPSDRRPPPPPEWKFIGRTDDLGRLETARPTDRDATVRVSLAGYRDEVRPVGGRVVTVGMQSAPAVVGHAVVASTGLPRKIREVRLLVLRGTEYGETPDRGRLFASLSPGKFVLGLPLQPGTYRVAVEADGDLTGQSAPFLFDGKSSPPPTIINLEYRMELRGFVRTEEGPLPDAAVRDVEVEILQADPASRSRQILFGVLVPSPFRVVGSTRVDDEGRFSFADLKPGIYRLRARKPGRAEFLSPPFVTPWEGEYPIVLVTGARLAGTLLGSESLPEPDVPIVLTRREETARVSWTDGDGKFEFADLTPGEEYRVTVGDPGFVPEGEAPGEGEEGSPTGEPGGTSPLSPPSGSTRLLGRALVVESDTVFNIRRKTSPFGSIQGKLTMGGEPVVGAALRLARESEDRGTPPAEGTPRAHALPEGDVTTTGPSGEFRWSGLAPGVYRIEGEGRLSGVDFPGARDVSVLAGRRAEVEVEIESIRHALRLTELGTGEPLSEAAEVEWERVSETGVPEGPVRRAEVPPGRARAEAAGLIAGRYRLRVRLGGLLVHEETAELRADSEGSLAIPPRKRVPVRLAAPGGGAYRGPAAVTLLRDGREVYAADLLVEEKVVATTTGPGRYELIVRAPSGVARIAFVVTENEVAAEEPSPQNETYDPSSGRP